MKNENSIEIDGLSKRYRLGTVGTGTLSHDINRIWYRLQGKEDPYLKVGDINLQSENIGSKYVYALNEVSVEIKRGEILGIIGKNGAGKSTLLKILSKITGPTKGEIRYRGSIGSLLEVGTGFHQELTGRENIFLNGAILGMTKKEIKNKFDDIVDFSGCNSYIDTPVKRYSSGMLVRLGFSVAAFLEPDILVVDEVLAVGDAEFQKRAIGKMQDISQKEGRTVLFVSHNMAAVKTLCNSALILKNGMILNKGEPKDIINSYLQQNSISSIAPIELRSDRKGLGQFRFKGITFLDSNGCKLNQLTTGENVKFLLEFTNLIPESERYSSLEIGVIVRDEFDNIITTLATFFTDENPVPVKDFKSILCSIPKLPLLEGQYHLDLWCAMGKVIQDWVENAVKIDVLVGNYYGSNNARLPHPKRHGRIVIPHKWDVK